MRKLIVQQWVSADGFATDSNGTTKFFEFPGYSTGWDEDQLELMKHIDTILLGANTYKMFLEYWPEADIEKDALAPSLNAMPKIVFSGTLKTAPWGNWKAATVIKDDVVEFVKQLKQKPGKDIILWGSLTLCKTLATANLIDEYHLTIAPAFTGSGKHFLREKAELLDMEVLHTKVYSSGVLSVTYRPKTKI